VARPRIEPLVILGAGLAGLLATSRRWSPRSPASPPWLGALLVGGGAAATVPDLTRLAWICFKAGAFVFGSGLAIVPLLEGETVRQHHWLTHSQFMDGLAFGQITPGPVVITATFIGYKVGGMIGALFATVAIFAPCFFNVLVILPRVLSRLRASGLLPRFASWAIPSVIGCIFGTTGRLGWLTLNRPAPIVIFILGLVASWRLKAPAWAVILLSGVAGGMVKLLLGA